MLSSSAILFLRLLQDFIIIYIILFEKKKYLKKVRKTIFPHFALMEYFAALK